MATNQPKKLTKKVARTTARSTARAAAKDLEKGEGRRRQARRAGRIVGRTVAKEGAKKNLTAEEMAVAAQRATKRTINRRVEGQNFRKQGGDLTKGEKRTVRRLKRDNVRSAATSSAKFGAKQLYDNTPMRNTAINRILGGTK